MSEKLEDITKQLKEWFMEEHDIEDEDDICLIEPMTEDFMTEELDRLEIPRKSYARSYFDFTQYMLDQYHDGPYYIMFYNRPTHDGFFSGFPYEDSPKFLTLDEYYDGVKKEWEESECSSFPSKYEWFRNSRWVDFFVISWHN